MIYTTTLKIQGMSCTMCSSAVSRVLTATTGIISNQVNFASADAVIKYDSDMITIDEIESIIFKTGFTIEKPSNLDNSDDLKNKETFYLKYRKNMIFAWIFAAPLMIMMMLCMYPGFDFSDRFMLLYHIVAIIFTLIVLFWTGAKTISNALKSIRNSAPNMDVLIMLGSFAALVTGLLPGMFGKHSFIEIGSMIMAIHLTGRYIEAKTRGKTSEAIRKLMELGAKSAFIRRGVDIVEVPVSELQLRDVMVIKPGAQIPTDGVIVSGDSYIDESMATGESMPVRKSVGKFIIGGTINGNGALEAEVCKLGSDTFLSQMIKLVEYAQNTKVPVQAFADKVTNYFVPLVLLLALASFLTHFFYPELRHLVMSFLPWDIHVLGDDMIDLTRALFISISVLVIACPCALGLATPTAIMAGIGLGTKHGILIRNGEAVQTIKSVSTIIFDKTGTLTLGKPTVTDMVMTAKSEKKSILSSLYLLVSLSDHPLSVAIVEKLKIETNNFENNEKSLYQITDFESITGKGLVGTINGEKWFVGSIKFMREIVMDFSEFSESIELFQNDGKTLVLVATGLKVVGLIAIADEIKPDAVETIRQLYQMKIKPVMLTGDNISSARAVARKLGITEVQAEVLPEQKLNYVEDYQSRGETVLMVGDGINDAPALKAADVSIAIGSGTDIAIDSADIVLIKNDILPVVKAISISNSIFSVIKQNLFWAFIYNLIAIPLAFFGFLHPIVAEIAMCLSSITVVSNANRLRNKRFT